MEGRLGNLPEALQLRILSCLDAKQAVQTSVLSKTWVSLWTRVPVLEFNCFSFNNISLFDNFVMQILRRRDHLARMDTLKFKGNYSCSTEILRSIFYYALSHGVKHLEASTSRLHANYSWPVSLCNSLTSLKLQSLWCVIRCLFLGTGSILFKNLTVLYLRGALITDVEPFSGFPVLESLTLLDCDLYKEGNANKTLKVHALRLSDLTISDCIGINSCELRTPRLKILEYRGFDFPKHDGLTVLETLVIDIQPFYSPSLIEQRQRLIEDLLSLFSTLPNLKWLTLSSDILYFLLFSYPDELARRSSPFQKLKELKLDFTHRSGRLFPSLRWELIKCVESYLLSNSPDAKFTTNNPEFESGDDFLRSLSV